MFVWVIGGMLQGCYVTICLWKESPATLETLGGQARCKKIDPSCDSSWQEIGMPQPDDVLPLFLSATVCLFGSWVGCNKGASAT